MRNNQYNTEIFLSSINKNINIKSFNTIFQKELCKAFLEDNNKNTNSYINNILSCITNIDIQDLSILDKLLILLKVRSRSIGNIISLSFKKENKKYDIEYSVSDVYSEILKIDIKKESINQGDILINMYIPRVYDEEHLFFNSEKTDFNYEDIIFFFIDSISIKDKKFLFKDLTFEQRKKVISNTFTVNTIKEVKNYILKVTNCINKIILYKDLDNTLNLNIIDGSLFDYIKFLFNENLYNIYQSIYILTKHVGLSAEYIENLTPVERDLYLKLLEKENAEISKANNDGQNNENINIPNNSSLDGLDTYAAAKGG